MLTVRLLSDGFSGDAVVALLGQAPREWVVTTGLVQGIAPATLFGTAAALVYGLREGPRPRFGVEDDRLNQPPGQRRTIAGLVGLPLTLVFVVTGWSSSGRSLAGATDTASTARWPVGPVDRQVGDQGGGGLRRKIGWSGAIRRSSSSADSGPTPSKNLPTSHFQRLR